MEMEAKYREYAKLLIETGVNLQKGQDLVLSCPVECAWFGRMCVEAAYDAGCREVVVSWNDDFVERQKFLRAADDVFDTAHQWEADFYNSYAKKGAGYLSISATDPENMKGVAPDRMRRSSEVSNRAFDVFYELEMSSGFPWCIASVPIPSWAMRVFPGVSEEEAMEKLWDAIFKTMRITGEGNAVELWKKHIDVTEEKVKKLNELRLDTLHYTNSLGTDLTVRLPKNNVWAAGGGMCKTGVYFVANMPTEEVFTAPRRDGIDGVVYASMPLVYNGNVIEGIKFVIKEGKIVEATATQNQDTLLDAISLDEGASHFGEVALVPYDSPINNLGILFYNTLFDENASCHMAFGQAYADCVINGGNMTQEELAAEGLNDSITHVDFMVGTKDLNIMGTTQDGRELPIFVNGDFAI